MLMSIYKYRVYQGEYCGPSKEKAFAMRPPSHDQVQDCFDKLRAILPNYFSTIVKDDSLFVTATTSNSEEDTDSTLEKGVVGLNPTTTGFSLYIDRLHGQ
jgi:hypothetical protein